MIPPRWKLYALAGAAFVAALLGWRHMAVRRAVRALEAQIEASRAKATARTFRAYQSNVRMPDAELDRRLAGRD